MGRHEIVDAQHQLGGRDQRRACAGRRFGDHRPATRLGQPQRGGGQLRGRVAEHDEGAGRQVVHNGDRPGGDPGGPGQPARPAAEVPIREVEVGHKGLAERQVEMDRTGIAAEPFRGRERPAGHRPPGGVLPGPVVRRADLDEQPHRVAVQLELVDGLVGAGAAQLGRPVGGEQQQRHVRVRRLEHGWVQVGRGRPGGGDDGHRAARGLREPEREEGRGPLVDPDVQPQPPGPVRIVQREREGSRPRSRRQHRLGDPAADQLIDQDAGQRGRRVHTGDPVAPSGPQRARMATC